MTEFSLPVASRVSIVLMLICATAGCQPQPYKSAVFEVEMGPKQNLKGVLASGFEMSAFTYCDRGFDNCRGVVADFGCWLESADRSDVGWQKFLTQKQITEGNAYLEFVGRESLRRGAYGHLGDYSCLIEVEKITFAKPMENEIPEEEK